MEHKHAGPHLKPGPCRQSSQLISMGFFLEAHHCQIKTYSRSTPGGVFNTASLMRYRGCTGVKHTECCRLTADSSCSLLLFAPERPELHFATKRSPSLCCPALAQPTQLLARK